MEIWCTEKCNIEGTGEHTILYCYTRHDGTPHLSERGNARGWGRVANMKTHFECTLYTCIRTHIHTRAHTRRQTDIYVYSIGMENYGIS